MDDALRDLSAVTRESVDVALKVRGVAVTVSEVTMSSMAPFIRACSPFLASFDQIAEIKETTGELAAAGGSAKRVPDRFGFFKTISEHSPAFLDAAALVCDIPDAPPVPVPPGAAMTAPQLAARAFLARLRPDEFFHIALAVVEVNGDFFILRLAPALQAFFRTVGRIGSGRTSDLSLPDTAGLNGSTPIATASS